MDLVKVSKQLYVNCPISRCSIFYYPKRVPYLNTLMIPEWSEHQDEYMCHIAMSSNCVPIISATKLVVSFDLLIFPPKQVLCKTLYTLNQNIELPNTQYPRTLKTTRNTHPSIQLNVNSPLSSICGLRQTRNASPHFLYQKYLLSCFCAFIAFHHKGFPQGLFIGLHTTNSTSAISTNGIW